MQRGLTLIEMVLTIAVITVGVVGVAGGLAQSEHIAGINQDQAQVEVAMRQVADYVGDSTASGLPYEVCAAPSAYSLTAGLTGLGQVYAYVSKVDESTPNSYQRDGSNVQSGVTLPPLPAGALTGQPSGRCTTGSQAGEDDYGVQEIWVTVCDSQTKTSCSPGGQSLTRIVWKSWK